MSNGLRHHLRSLSFSQINLPSAPLISLSNAVTLIAFNLSHNCCSMAAVVNAFAIAVSIAFLRQSACVNHFSFKSSCLQN